MQAAPGAVAPLAVTVSSAASPLHVALARDRALAWGVPYVDRARNAPLEPLFARASSFLVRGGDGWTLTDPEGSLRFSPGMAHLRIKRFDAGFVEDLLIRLGELRPGDRVLDCTLGLGADALVAARVAGATGRVVAVEKSLALFALAAEALAKPWRADFAPIEVRHADSALLLPTLASKSFEVVLFDPMFGRPNKSAPAFDSLRRHADFSPLTAQMLAEAQRVASRCVLVKGARYSKDFKKLGLIAAPRSPSRGVLWARLETAAQNAPEADSRPQSD